MALSVDEVYCRNCSEMLFRTVRNEDGTVRMNDPGMEPETDGIQKYYRCPTCRGKNLAMLIEDPPGSRYYEIAGFVRS